MPRIPDRWLSYSSIGKVIAGTRFICFKVPLKDTLCNSLQENERFTPEMLMESCPKLGLVLDLTNTNRYYNGQIFATKGIKYKKILCPGQIVPPGKILQEFFLTVDAFLNESDEQDSLIGVHCTHGLNRTGYFVCRYLNQRMGFNPQDAITAFEDARGHKIERRPYIEEIFAAKKVGISGTEGGNEPNLPSSGGEVYSLTRSASSSTNCGSVYDYQNNFIPPGSYQNNCIPPGSYQNNYIPPGSYQNNCIPPGINQNNCIPPGSFQNSVPPVETDYQFQPWTSAPSQGVSSRYNGAHNASWNQDNFSFQSPLSSSYYEEPSYSSGYGSVRTHNRAYHPYLRPPDSSQRGRASQGDYSEQRGYLGSGYRGSRGTPRRDGHGGKWQ